MSSDEHIPWQKMSKTLNEEDEVSQQQPVMERMLVWNTLRIVLNWVQENQIKCNEHHIMHLA